MDISRIQWNRFMDIYGYEQHMTAILIILEKKLKHFKKKLTFVLLLQTL